MILIQQYLTSFLKKVFLSPSKSDLTMKSVVTYSKFIPKGLAGRQEVLIHGQLADPKNDAGGHIIPLLGVKEHELELELIMPKIPMTLLDVVTVQPQFLPIRTYFRQLARGLHYIHSQHIVHGDIKLENILVDVKVQRCYIIDFGFSRHFEIGEHIITHRGSPHYAAPEIFDAKLHEAPKIDIWALGVVLYILFTGFFPFSGPSFKIRCQMSLGIPSHEKIPDAVKNLLKAMMNLDYSQRPTTSQILEHAWVARCDH
jgi:serine/threonine protein kinase